MLPLVALLAIGMSLPRAVPLPLAAPLAEPPAPSYYWRWSDGSTASARTLVEPPDGLPPTILVTAAPPVSGRIVELQFRSPSGWTTEDIARTDRQGRARLGINPYCQDGAWCHTELAYRMRVDGRTASLRIRFVPAISPTGG